MAWPSMEDKILPATLDLPHSAATCSNGYAGLGYRAPENTRYDQATRKSTWEAIPQAPLFVAWHVRGKTAFLCSDLDARLKSARGDAECFTHSLPVVWVKYEFSPKQAQARPSGPALKKQREARKAAPEAPGSSLHSPSPGPDAGGVVRVRVGGGEADTLLHEAESEVSGAGVQGDLGSGVALLQVREAGAVCGEEGEE